MRKTSIILLTAILSTGYIVAQDWNSSLKLSIGTGYLSDASFDDTPLITLESAHSYKWLDLAYSLDYISSSGKYFDLSVNFKPKVDIIKIFTKDSNHSAKIGTGFGLGITSNKIYEWYEIPASVRPDTKTLLFYKNSVMVSYEYQICNKTWAGAFFENYISDVFFGKYYIGLSIRRDF
ncbi:hypothetical protein HW49_10745 [Porphyromonadaceae bacterium COT-184 OH4590]|nr:hypothetical protein HW49_10745 [Porphyromonadaceae bacterium COT-184 OH4590]